MCYALGFEMEINKGQEEDISETSHLFLYEL